MNALWHTGDALTVLRTFETASVDLVITSPPFLALRSYLPADHPDKGLEMGSEPDPGSFVDALVRVVEECRRVLAPHGSMCIELGDTYAGSGGAGGDYNENGLREGQPKFQQQGPRGSGDGHDRNDPNRPSSQAQTGMVPVKAGHHWPLAKSLSLVPEITRFTLAYGHNPLTGRETEQWRIRNVIRWVRTNPPVGALGDKFRPGTSEMLVACVSDKRYFDLDAVRNPSDYDRPNLRGQGARAGNAPNGQRPNMSDHTTNPAGVPPLDWWEPIADAVDRTLADAAAKQLTPQQLFGETDNETRETPGRKLVRLLAQDGLIDLGDALLLSTKGYKGAHYATFPPGLCVQAILAMCPEKVCRTCGEPSRRVVDISRVTEPDDSTRNPNGQAAQLLWEMSHTTVGWSDCGHDDWRPGVVLDPFAGTGTVGAVATGHSRDFVGIDLDPCNVELAEQRIGPMFFERAETPA